MGCAASKKAVEPGGVWPQEPKSPAIKSPSAGYTSPKTAEGDEPMPERPSQIARQASDFRRRRLSHGMAEPDTAADAAADSNLRGGERAQREAHGAAARGVAPLGRDDRLGRDDAPLAGDVVHVR